MNDQLRTCDIVMKGGITSGVVYPKAIAELSKRFTFKNVGGTSAGAIAAAAAAAAEYRRIKTGTREGFDLLDNLGDVLSSTPLGSKNTFLFNLFEPNRKTKKVFNVFVAALGEKSTIRRIFGVTVRAVREYFDFAMLGTLAGAALAVISFLWAENQILRWVWVVVGVSIAMVGGLIATAAALLLNAVAALPSNYFGFCSGMQDPGLANKSKDGPLTEWLTNYLNEVAGIKEDADGPLTFGHLWNPHQNVDQGTNREVTLEMMTTNLTHGRPYKLPFRYDADLKENNLFYFRKDEFERLFPKCVVDWMLAHPRPIDDVNAMEKRLAEREERKELGYYPLPAPADLPVVVATRMSLSFPILLSVIPLHSIDYSIDEDHRRVERCWFTDGGACSNFPVHFFDSAIPRRPTFSIDLVQRPDDTPDADLVPRMDNYNVAAPMDRWNRFDLVASSDASKTPVEKGNLSKLFGFFGTLISTMQNWNDATTGRLPGYRDRIVRIPLTSRQGGLNLTMPPDLVSFLSDQGTKSAKQLIAHFDVPATHETMTWENHRWIRIRSMLASLERMVDVTLATCNSPESKDVSYEDWLRELLADTTGKHEELSYAPTKKQIEAALKTIEIMRELKNEWDSAGTAADGAPKPRPILRPRPQI